LPLLCFALAARLGKTRKFKTAQIQGEIIRGTINAA
jgi:hypothetical protein